MTYARLAYRPETVQELKFLLDYLKKQEIKQEYANNTLSLILNAIRPEMKRLLFSDFAKKLEEPKQAYDDRNGDEIVEEIKEKIKEMIEKRKEEKKWTAD